MKKIVSVILCLFVFCGLSFNSINAGSNISNIAVNNNSSSRTILVSNVSELMETERLTKEGDITVLIADGDYVLPKGLYLTGSNITYKSQSGNRDKVVLRGDFKISHIFQITNDNVTIQDMTIGQVNNHGIQLHSETDADNGIIKNIRFFDIKEQMIKGSGASTEVYSNNCLVENCLFEFTNSMAYQYYTGGIDVHKGDSWVVRNNTFKNIISPSSALSEGAIHFWSSSKNTLIENNVIINCDRGIMLGLDNSFHFGGIVKNNFVHVVRDTGIYLANADGARVYNNTVYVDSNYPNAIEYRFLGTKNSEIINNLANKAITSRNGGSALVSNNLTNASERWFLEPHRGNLHLVASIQELVDKATDILQMTTDIDGDIRKTGLSDIGADEYIESISDIPCNEIDNSETQKNSYKKRTTTTVSTISAEDKSILKEMLCQTFLKMSQKILMISTVRYWSFFFMGRCPKPHPRRKAGAMIMALTNRMLVDACQG